MTPPSPAPAASGRGPVVVAGVDPGLAATGYGFICGSDEGFAPVEFGTIVTPPARPEHQRLRMLYGELLRALRRHRPSVVVVEKLFFNRNARSALSVGQARGVVLLAAARAGCAVVELTPQQAKMGVSGFGRGDKAQVAYMVRQLLGLERTPGPHEADALALALSGAQICLHGAPAGAWR